MKKLWKKAITGILVLVLCVGLLPATAFAVEDNIVVIREDTTVDGDFTIEGELYIVEGAQLITTGDVTIYGEVYVFGSWRNTGAISGEGTIHCLHYNSMSFAFDAAGHFSSTTNSGGRNPSLAVSVNNSYLDTPIPEGHTYDPETGETTDYEPGDEPDSEPDAGQPEDTTKPEPDDSPVVLSRTSSAASYIINAYDEDGNYYSSAISSVSLTESSVVLGSQTQILFGVAFAPSNGWEVEEVTFDGEKLALEYDSDTGKYSTSVYYRGTADPTLTVDIVVKWAGNEEAEPESNPDPEDTTDSEPEDTTDSEPDGTTDSGTKSSPDSAGHVYDFDNIEWQWTSDYSAANAYVYCVDGDGAAKAYEAEIESYSNDYGGTTYVATIVDENGNTYSEQVELDADGNLIDVASGTDGSGSTGSSDSSGSTGSSDSSGNTGSSDSSGSTAGTSGTTATASTVSGTGGTASTLSTASTTSTGSTDSSGSTTSTGSTDSSGSTTSTGNTDSSGSTGSTGTGSSGTGSSGSGYTGSSGSGYTGSTGTGSSASGYTGSSGSSTSTAAQTDDSAMPYVYLALALCAGAAVVTFSVRRRVTRG